MGGILPVQRAAVVPVLPDVEEPVAVPGRAAGNLDADKGAIVREYVVFSSDRLRLRDLVRVPQAHRHGVIFGFLGRRFSPGRPDEGDQPLQQVGHGFGPLHGGRQEPPLDFVPQLFDPFGPEELRDNPRAEAGMHGEPVLAGNGPGKGDKAVSGSRDAHIPLGADADENADLQACRRVQ